MEDDKISNKFSLAINSNIGLQKKLSNKFSAIINIGVQIDAINKQMNSIYLNEGKLIYSAIGVGLAYEL